VLRAGLTALAVGLAACTPALAATPGNAVAGKTLFKANCGKCHTLTTAGTVAKSPNAGPALDGKHEPTLKVLKQMTNGTGLMPSFAGKLSPKQMNDVAAFVVAATKAKS
jgi:mono/diheme cytochrome c family protein